MGKVPQPAIHLVSPDVEHRDKVRAVRPSPREDKGGIRGGRLQPQGGQEHHRERETRRAQRNDTDCGGQAQRQDAVRGFPYLLYRRHGNRTAHQERPYRESITCLYKRSAHYPKTDSQLPKGNTPQTRIG